MGVAAARAKQVAEQLLGSRESAKEDAKHRAETLVDEGRRAAADVVSALRREASVLFRDLEHLEEHLRGGKPSGAAPAGNGAAPGDEPAAPRPKAPAAQSAAAKKTPGARKSAVGPAGGKRPTATEAGGRRSGPTEKVTGVGKKAAAKISAVKATARKAPVARTAVTRTPVAKAPVVKAPAAKAPVARKGGGAGRSTQRSGTTLQGRS
jgi:hypothetical protein